MNELQLKVLYWTSPDGSSGSQSINPGGEYLIIKGVDTSGNYYDLAANVVNSPSGGKYADEFFNGSDLALSTLVNASMLLDKSCIRSGKTDLLTSVNWSSVLVMRITTKDRFQQGKF